MKTFNIQLMPTVRRVTYQVQTVTRPPETYQLKVTHASEISQSGHQLSHIAQILYFMVVSSNILSNGPIGLMYLGDWSFKSFQRCSVAPITILSRKPHLLKIALLRLSMNTALKRLASKEARKSFLYRATVQFQQPGCKRLCTFVATTRPNYLCRDTRSGPFIHWMSFVGHGVIETKLK